VRAVQFFEGSVLSENGTGPDGEHMYSFDYEYRLEVVRDWMFQQTRTTSALRLYQQGESLRDSAQGFAPMLLAAELGYGPAQSRVGSAYQYGRGVARDYGKAAERIASAWDLGHMKAPRYLGIMQYEKGLGVERDPSKALAWYRVAAKDNDPEAIAAVQRLSAVPLTK